MKPRLHAQISAKKYGGKPEDYQHLHDFFDQTKEHIADVRHRAVLHNAWGIFLLEKMYGIHFTNSEGKEVSVRDVGEQHVLDDLGRIPSLDECLKELPHADWFGGPVKSKKVLTPDQLEVKLNDLADSWRVWYEGNCY